ncbi:hypothetical protein AB0J21_19740 [Streptomyces sp. NPDC049954]|uniref:hypothetical protein n=1 Tax=Streptomyces sp. NPDC049954 TaxID=3155779 RepID=UPI00343ABB90
MGETPPKAPGEHGNPPVPRDMPDQQSRPGEDPLDIQPPPANDGSGKRGGSGQDVPDTDEAGTGRAGDTPADESEGPAPEESTG